MHELLLFIQRWSPHLWLFGSIFGVVMSATLFKQARDYRKEIGGRGTSDTADFWYRHGVWFLLMHVAFMLVGVLAVAKVQTDVSNLFVLTVLLAIPLILVYRSYDSLRLHSRERNGE